MAKKISIATGKGLKINSETQQIEVDLGLGLQNVENEIDVNIGNGLQINNSNQVEVKNNGQKGIDVDTNGVKIKNDPTSIEFNELGLASVKTGQGLTKNANGVNVNVDNETIKVDENNKLKVVGSAPDIQEGQGIKITTQGTTSTIGVEVDDDTIEVDEQNKLRLTKKLGNIFPITIDKESDDPNNNRYNIGINIGKGLDLDETSTSLEVVGGNGIGVGNNGVSVNVDRGINIQSNKVGINANFTTKSTPLGSESSNIELYSDGKIKVVGGGGKTIICKNTIFLMEQNGTPQQTTIQAEDLHYQLGIAEGNKVYFTFLNGNFNDELGRDFLDKYAIKFRHHFRIYNAGDTYFAAKRIQFSCMANMKISNFAFSITNISNSQITENQTIGGRKDYIISVEGIIIGGRDIKDLSNALIEITPTLVVQQDWTLEEGSTTFNIEPYLDGTYYVALPK